MYPYLYLYQYCILIIVNKQIHKLTEAIKQISAGGPGLNLVHYYGIWYY